METFIHSNIHWIIPLLILLSLWEMVWKLIGLWKSARANQKVWFILIALINTMGILPIIYIITQRKK